MPESAVLNEISPMTDSHAPSPLTIGVLGGMGPQAGIDLVNKITAATDAAKDQDHLPVILMSLPQIPDRTAWLADPSATDPAPAIAEGFVRLERAGAGVAAMACNTAHTPALFNRVQDILRHAGAGIHILHLIQETVGAIRHNHPAIRRVGILGTHGTLSSGLYHDFLENAGYEVVAPSDTNRLTKAIYDPDTGIKARSSPVTEVARERVLQAASELARQGAEAVILGCTELPIAVPESNMGPIPFIDPARMLARALIQASDPSRVRPSS
jgi:aspartate racemase